MYIDKIFQEMKRAYDQAGLPQSSLKKSGSETHCGDVTV
jgi:hypothetical protein